MFNKTNQKQKATEKYLSPVILVGWKKSSLSPLGSQYRLCGVGGGGLSSSKWVKPFFPEYGGGGGGVVKLVKISNE